MTKLLAALPLIAFLGGLIAWGVRLEMRVEALQAGNDVQARWIQALVENAMDR